VLIAFDTETTGLVKSTLLPLDRQPEMIEFYGCVFTPEGEILKELELLIKPRALPLPAVITKITGLTDEDLKDAPDVSEVVPAIAEFLESVPTVYAHNASFDRDIIDIAMKRAEREPVKWPQLVCTVEQTMAIKGYRLKLVELHEHLFGEKFDSAHRARYDVQALVRCIVRLKADGVLP
jgi:DNA polymerase III alpha subunit (gram-positive type)